MTIPELTSGESRGYLHFRSNEDGIEYQFTDDLKNRTFSPSIDAFRMKGKVQVDAVMKK
jgi:hypothetical protein